MIHLPFMCSLVDQVSPTTSSWTLVEDGDGEPPSKRARVAGRKENQEWEGVEEQEQEDLPPADYQDLARVKQKDLTLLNKKAKTKLSVRSYYSSETPALTTITESSG